MKLAFQIKMIKYWFVFYIVLSSLSLYAVEVKDLYIAKVEVSSQSKKDRGIALKNAMRSVLVKVGGQKSILQEKSLKPALKRYNNFVTNYRYERASGISYLVASFDQEKIEQLFVEAGLPIWGSLRPQVVLWLVDENNLQRQIISESSSSLLANSVELFSQQRGLPITMPLMDLDDANQIGISAIWGRFAQPVKQASKRYLAEAIVTIRLSNSTMLPEEALDNSCEPLCQQMYALDWSFISSTYDEELQRFSERYQGIDKESLLIQALSDITDKIYQDYALTTAENNEYLIDVVNIDNLTNYVAVDRFLQTLSSVRAAKLVSVDGTTYRFSLSLLGSERAFLASLKLNNTLRQYVDPLALVDNRQIPIFYWGDL